ncbi:hypothetical protein [Desulfosarcina widdelii]|uniref:hypothetical protein n=1 Tax=Desulfosarcina widdelii TaxID=947919 RepID=UPI0012D2D82C|nr:hypothetical protein [Desulfosarcina widdelii]
MQADRPWSFYRPEAHCTGANRPRPLLSAVAALRGLLDRRFENVDPAAESFFPSLSLVTFQLSPPMDDLADKQFTFTDFFREFALGAKSVKDFTFQFEVW